MQIAVLYHFTPMADLPQLREDLLAFCKTHAICGTILIAPEGLNGTVAGDRGAIAALIEKLRALPGCNELEAKYSNSSDKPFLRMKVRIKREIVTMGAPLEDIAAERGQYADPELWNALIDDPDTLVIDTRNDYEIAIGSFEGAINPNTENFRQFPAWFDRFAQQLPDKNQKIAMFCTGGIRCEKATAYVRAKGFDQVYHLQGGVLKYLEQTPAEQNRFDGDCFVFDQRVAVNHALEPSGHHQCHGCRHPLSEADLASEFYEPGVTCPHCAAQRSEEEQRRYRSRWKQVSLARQRGDAHLGSDTPQAKK